MITKSLLCYHGKSDISKTIMRLTNVVDVAPLAESYSHVAWRLRDGRVIHCYQMGTLDALIHGLPGVEIVAGPDVGHLNETPYDIYPVDLTDAQHDALEAAMLADVGVVKYDFMGLLQFLDADYVQPADRAVCSTWIFAKLLQIGLQPLVRIRADKVSPQHFGIMPLFGDPEQSYTQLPNP